MLNKCLNAIACMTLPCVSHHVCWYACRFETGDVFALDMGGTNFRTVYVKLSDKHGQMVNICSFCVSAVQILITC